MVRAAKSDRSAKLPPPADTAASPFLEWVFRPAMLFRMALVAGAFALWPYVAQRMPSLGKRSEYRLMFRQIQISPKPEHPVPDNLLDQVERQSGLPAELALLDENLPGDVARAFSQHPWIARVVRVQKAYPASIVVELEFRQPVAMVQVPGGRLPIDVEGTVLPTSDFSAADAGRYPVIQDVASRSAIRPGTVWDDPALLAAARLAALLKDKWSALKLDAISVPRKIDPSTPLEEISLELVGAGGSKILWGRMPGTDHPGELLPEQKIRRLENYLSEFGGYTAPHGPYEIDIRHWRENARRPLGSDPGQSKPIKRPKEDQRIQSTEGKRKTRG